MVNNSHSKDFPLPPDLDPADLQEIFNNIEENLAFWKVLNNDLVQSQDDGLPVSLTELTTISDWLKMSSAPLYPTQGMRGVRGLIYRFLNAIVKVFGYPQILFNRRLREFLGEQMLTLNKINSQTLSLKTTIEKLGDRIRELEAQNNDYRQEIEYLHNTVSNLQSDLIRITGERQDKDRS